MYQQCHVIRTLSNLADINQHADFEKLEENMLTNRLLDKNAQNVKQSRNIYMKEYRKKTSSYKEKNNAYMKEYMKRNRSTQDPQSKQEKNEKMNEYMKRKWSIQDPEYKQKKNEYMKELGSLRMHNFT